LRDAKRTRKTDRATRGTYRTILTEKGECVSKLGEENKGAAYYRRYEGRGDHVLATGNSKEEKITRKKRGEGKAIDR